MRKVILPIVLFALCLCACQKEQKQANTRQTVTNQTPIQENTDDNQSSDYKKMSEEEREKWCLSKTDGYKMDEIFYRTTEELSSKMEKGNSFVIDTTECKEYQEKRYGTSKVSGAVKGYIDSEYHFSVKYVSNNSGGIIVNGSFYDGTWHTSEDIMATPDKEYEFGDNGETCELIGRGFGRCDKIVVRGSSGKIMYQMDMKKFEKSNHVKAEFVSCSLLGNGRCILFYGGKKEKAGYLVNLKKEKIIKKYQKNFEFADCIASGDNYFYVLEDSIIEMYSLKDGSMTQTIDISNLVDKRYHGKLYEFDEEENEYSSFANCYTDIKLTVDRDVVYIGTCSGVYKWKEGEKVFHKILDAGNTKYYKKTIGTIKVAGDGTIYCLGISKPHLGEDYEPGSDELLVFSEYR